MGRAHASFTFVVDHSMFRDVARSLVLGENPHPHIKLCRARRTVLRKRVAGKPRPYPAVHAPPLLTASQVGISQVHTRNKIKDARPRGRSKKLPEAPTYPVRTHRTYSGCLSDAQRYVMCHLKRTSQQTRARRNDQSHSRSQSSFEQRVDPID